MHIHTSLSDSTFSPEDVVRQAAHCNLSAIAITDHDCIDAIAPAIGFASPYNIEIIPGVELSVKTEGGEVHILGFYIDWKNESLVRELEENCRMRVERIHKMIAKLKESRIDVDAEDVLRLSGRGSVGRMHLAAVLFKRGYISSIEEAFAKFIGDDRPCYVSRMRPTPKEAVEMINRAGGIAVLAHPRAYSKRHKISEGALISQLIRDGIRGIEVYCPYQSEFTIEKYKDLARKHGLLITGGSDCHGLGKGEVSMGKVKVAYELVEKLRDSIGR